MLRGAGGHLALLAALALLLVPAAVAHANLASSDPAAGARLDRAPAAVTLTMTEPVDPAGTRVEVTDCAGRRVDLGDLTITPGPNPVLRLGLQEGLAAGAYAIHWAAFSSTDGHHIDGIVGFAVGPLATPCAAHGHTHGLDLLPSALARALLYVGFSLAFGGAAFLAWMRRPAEGLARGAIAWGAALHLAGTLLLVQLTLDEVGLGWDRIGASAVGRILLARVLLGAGALVLATLAQARPTRTGPWAAVLLLLAAGLGAARLGHGSSDGPATIALDLLHLVTATAWAGSLALLLVALHRGLRGGADPAALRAMGIRYGTLALACVVLLWSTGAIVALAILGREGVLHPGRTLGSAYGAFLAAKMALATLMLAIAALNRYVFLEPPVDRGLAGALQRGARRLSRSRAGPLSFSGRGLRNAVAVEAALGAIVLLLAGLLTSAAPPEAAAEPPSGLLAQGHTFAVRLDAQPAPHLGGSSVLALAIEEAATGTLLANNTCGNPVASCVLAEVAYPGLNGTEAHEAHLEGSRWLVHGIVWARAGPATVTVSVSSAEVFRDRIAFSIQVPA